MDSSAVWGALGIIATIVIGVFSAKKMKLWGHDIKIGGDAKGDVFIGNKINGKK